MNIIKNSYFSKIKSYYSKPNLDKVIDGEKGATNDILLKIVDKVVKYSPSLQYIKIDNKFANTNVIKYLTNVSINLDFKDMSSTLDISFVDIQSSVTKYITNFKESRNVLESYTLIKEPFPKIQGTQKRFIVGNVLASNVIEGIIFNYVDTLPITLLTLTDRYLQDKTNHDYTYNIKKPTKTDTTELLFVDIGDTTVEVLIKNGKTTKSVNKTFFEENNIEYNFDIISKFELNSRISDRLLNYKNITGKKPTKEFEKLTDSIIVYNVVDDKIIVPKLYNFSADFKNIQQISNIPKSTILLSKNNFNDILLHRIKNGVLYRSISSNEYIKINTNTGIVMSRIDSNKSFFEENNIEILSDIPLKDIQKTALNLPDFTHKVKSRVFEQNLNQDTRLLINTSTGFTTVTNKVINTQNKVIITPKITFEDLWVNTHPIYRNLNRYSNISFTAREIPKYNKNEEEKVIVETGYKSRLENNKNSLYIKEELKATKHQVSGLKLKISDKLIYEKWKNDKEHFEQTFRNRILTDFVFEPIDILSESKVILSEYRNKILDIVHKPLKISYGTKQRLEDVKERLSLDKDNVYIPRRNILESTRVKITDTQINHKSSFLKLYEIQEPIYESLYKSITDRRLRGYDSFKLFTPFVYKPKTELKDEELLLHKLEYVSNPISNKLFTPIKSFNYDLTNDTLFTNTIKEKVNIPTYIFNTIEENGLIELLTNPITNKLYTPLKPLNFPITEKELFNINAIIERNVFTKVLTKKEPIVIELSTNPITNKLYTPLKPLNFPITEKELFNTYPALDNKLYTPILSEKSPIYLIERGTIQDKVFVAKKTFNFTITPKELINTYPALDNKLYTPILSEKSPIYLIERGTIQDKVFVALKPLNFIITPKELLGVDDSLEGKIYKTVTSSKETFENIFKWYISNDKVYETKKTFNFVKEEIIKLDSFIFSKIYKSKGISKEIIPTDINQRNYVIPEFIGKTSEKALVELIGRTDIILDYPVVNSEKGDISGIYLRQPTILDYPLVNSEKGLVNILDLREPEFSEYRKPLLSNPTSSIILFNPALPSFPKKTEERTTFNSENKSLNIPTYRNTKTSSKGTINSISQNTLVDKVYNKPEHNKINRELFNSVTISNNTVYQPRNIFKGLINVIVNPLYATGTVYKHHSKIEKEILSISVLAFTDSPFKRRYLPEQNTLCLNTKTQIDRIYETSYERVFSTFTDYNEFDIRDRNTSRIFDNSYLKIREALSLKTSLVVNQKSGNFYSKLAENSHLLQTKTTSSARLYKKPNINNVLSFDTPIYFKIESKPSYSRNIITPTDIDIVTVTAKKKSNYLVNTGIPTYDVSTISKLSFKRNSEVKLNTLRINSTELLRFERDIFNVGVSKLFSYNNIKQSTDFIGYKTNNYKDKAVAYNEISLENKLKKSYIQKAVSTLFKPAVSLLRYDSYLMNAKDIRTVDYFTRDTKQPKYIKPFKPTLHFDDISNGEFKYTNNLLSSYKHSFVVETKNVISFKRGYKEYNKLLSDRATQQYKTEPYKHFITHTPKFNEIETGVFKYENLYRKLTNNHTPFKSNEQSEQEFKYENLYRKLTNNHTPFTNSAEPFLNTLRNRLFVINNPKITSEVRERVIPKFRREVDFGDKVLLKIDYNGIKRNVYSFNILTTTNYIQDLLLPITPNYKSNIFKTLNLSKTLYNSSNIQLKYKKPYYIDVYNHNTTNVLNTIPNKIYKRNVLSNVVNIFDNISSTVEFVYNRNYLENNKTYSFNITSNVGKIYSRNIFNELTFTTIDALVPVLTTKEVLYKKPLFKDVKSSISVIHSVERVYSKNLFIDLKNEYTTKVQKETIYKKENKFLNISTNPTVKTSIVNLYKKPYFNLNVITPLETSKVSIIPNYRKQYLKDVIPEFTTILSGNVQYVLGKNVFQRLQLSNSTSYIVTNFLNDNSRLYKNDFEYAIDNSTFNYRVPKLAVVNKPLYLHTDIVRNDQWDSQLFVELRTLQGYNKTKKYAFDFNTQTNVVLRYKRDIKKSLNVNTDYLKPFRYNNNLEKYIPESFELKTLQPPLVNNYLRNQQVTFKHTVQNNLNEFRYPKSTNYKTSINLDVQKSLIYNNYSRLNSYTKPDANELFDTGISLTNIYNNYNRLSLNKLELTSKLSLKPNYDNNLEKYTSIDSIVVNINEFRYTRNKNIVTNTSYNVNTNIRLFSNYLQNTKHTVLTCIEENPSIEKIYSKPITNQKNSVNQQNTVSKIYNNYFKKSFETESVFELLKTDKIFRYTKKQSISKYNNDVSVPKKRNNIYLKTIPYIDDTKIFDYNTKSVFRYDNNLAKYNSQQIKVHTLDKPNFSRYPENLKGGFEPCKVNLSYPFRYNNNLEKYVKSQNIQEISDFEFIYNKGALFNFHKKLSRIETKQISVRSKILSAQPNNTRTDKFTFHNNIGELVHRGTVKSTSLETHTQFKHNLVNSQTKQYKFHNTMLDIKSNNHIRIQGYPTSTDDRSKFGFHKQINNQLINRITTKLLTDKQNDSSYRFADMSVVRYQKHNFKNNFKYNTTEGIFTIKGPVQYNMYGDEVSLYIAKPSKVSMAWERDLLPDNNSNQRVILQEDSMLPYFREKEIIVVTDCKCNSIEHQIEAKYGSTLFKNRIDGRYYGDRSYPVVGVPNATVKGIMKPSEKYIPHNIVQEDFSKAETVIFPECGDRTSLFSDRFFLQ